MKRRQVLAFIHALLTLAAVFAIFPPRALGEPLVSRLLVVAPHPDDETLAVGGLIHSLVRDGARVKVVFMIQGDGYPLAARALSGAIDLEPDDYVALGTHRRGESVAALATLGVGSESAE